MAARTASLLRHFLYSKSKAAAGLAQKKLITSKNKNTLQQLNEYRLSNHLCDVVLVTGDREFPAHRVVLAAGGGFFSGLFASNMREQTESKIELPQVDHEVFNDILGFIYTGQMEVNRENAQRIIMAADFLLLEEIKQSVDEFLAPIFLEDSSLTPSDIASAYQFASQYDCISLVDVLFKQVCKNFEKIVSESDSEEAFLEFDAKSLLNVLSSDSVVVSSEDVAFKAVMKWVRHRKDREPLLHQLLSHIRLCSLSEDFIQSEVLKDPIVASSPDCVLKVQTFLRTSYDPTDVNLPHARDCLDAYTHAIFVIPQNRTHHHSCIPDGVWCYIPSTNFWFYIPNVKHFKLGLPFFHKGSLFTVMVDSDKESTIHLKKHDLQVNTWSSVFEGVPGSTWNVCRAYLKGTVYIIGGTENNAFCSNDVLACDLESHPLSFKRVASLNTPRDTPSVVSDNQYIYVMGGEIDFGVLFSETNTMERYNPDLNSWSYLSPAPCNIGGSRDQSTLVNGVIFVIQKDVLTDAHLFDLMYNIGTNTWSKIPAAPLSTEGGVLTPYQDKLYLIGGGHSNSRLPGFRKGNVINIVCYDLKENLWSDVISTTKVKVTNRYGNGKGEPLDCIDLGGTAVRLRKDFISTLQLLQHVKPQS